MNSHMPKFAGVILIAALALLAGCAARPQVTAPAATLAPTIVAPSAAPITIVPTPAPTAAIPTVLPPTAAHDSATTIARLDALMAQLVEADQFSGAGGVYATAEDLWRWEQALYTDRPLAQAARTAMFTGYTSMGLEPELTYGYGWAIGNVEGHVAVMEGGAVPGYKSLLMRFPDERGTIILLMNEEVGAIETLLSQIVEIVFAA